MPWHARLVQSTRRGPGKWAMRWCTCGVGSRSGTKLKHEATCAVLRHRRQNGAWSADVVEEGANWSLVLELGNLGAMSRRGIAGDDCVTEHYVYPPLTRETIVNFLVSMWSLVSSRRLLGLLVLHGLSVIGKPCCEFVNDVK